MPKPLFIRRPSGLYVRFLVPVSCREAAGSRFIVRALGDLRGDAARLTAARLGYALSQQFDAMRGRMIEDKGPPQRPMRIATSTDTDPWGFETVHYTLEISPDGTRKIQVSGPKDHARALEMLRHLQAEYHPEFASSTPVAPSKPAAVLDERMALFLKQFAQKKRAAANVLDTTHTLRLFLGVVGNKPVADVGSEDMDIFMDAIAAWPVNASKKPDYKGLAPLAVVAKARQLHPPTIGLRTQEKHLDCLRKFLNWCVKRRDIPDNPASSLHVLTRDQEDEHSRRAFLPDELRALFDPTHREKHCSTPSRWWIPLLSLYSGARVNELAQLYTADVEEVAGVWGYHIATRFPGQQLKNTNSKRFVPLHSVLLDAGFLAYVADRTQASTGPSPLFPGLGQKPGDKVGDWWNRTYMPVCGVEDPKVVFHCFRHTFSTQAERAQVPESRIAKITGHASSGTTLRKHYIADANAMADVLASWPRNRGNYPEFKDLPARQVAAITKNKKLQVIQRSTQHKHIMALNAFFNWCVKLRAVRENPFHYVRGSRYRDAVPKKRDIFSAQNLQSLFAPEHLANYTEPHKYWVPLIAMFTGMRVNEISQLYVEDVQSDMEMDDDGVEHVILYFDITPFRDGQSVKTGYSIRRIPVHSRLLELGFERYVADVRASGSEHLLDEP